jgi:hypothetical protein
MARRIKKPFTLQQVCAPWYGCRVCYPNGETPVKRVLAELHKIEAARRASPALRAQWAAMAGKQEAPGVSSSRGLSTSTALDGSDGCTSDGA